MVNLDKPPPSSHPLGSSSETTWVHYAVLLLITGMAMLPLFLGVHPASRATPLRHDQFHTQVLLPRRIFQTQAGWSNGPEVNWAVLFSKDFCETSAMSAAAFGVLANATSRTLRFGMVDCSALPHVCDLEKVHVPSLGFYRTHESAHASRTAKLPSDHIDHPDHREFEPPAFARESVSTWQIEPGIARGKLVAGMLSWLRRAQADGVSDSAGSSISEVGSGEQALELLVLPSAEAVLEMMAPAEPRDEL